MTNDSEKTKYSYDFIGIHKDNYDKTTEYDK
jgi:hypothetical protein